MKCSNEMFCAGQDMFKNRDNGAAPFCEMRRVSFLGAFIFEAL